MASPHVAGAVALYIAANGRANDAVGVADIRQALIDAAEPQTAWLTADTNNNLGTKDPDGKHEGLVDAEGAPAPGSDYPPSVSWYNPVSGNVSGAVALEITATDDLSLAGDVTVEWRVAGDPSWQTATYDTGTGTYKATWDTTVGSFPDGPYTLEARATDNQDTVDTADDNVSAPVSIGVTVQNAMATAVSVDSIGFGRYGGKGGTKHLLITVTILDNLNGPVEGASVTLKVIGLKGGTGTGTTLADGTVAFSLKNAPICGAGNPSYTATVTNITAAGLTWNSSDLANTDSDCM